MTYEENMVTVMVGQRLAPAEMTDEGDMVTVMVGQRLAPAEMADGEGWIR